MSVELEQFVNKLLNEHGAKKLYLNTIADRWNNLPNSPKIYKNNTVLSKDLKLLGFETTKTGEGVYISAYKGKKLKSTKKPNSVIPAKVVIYEEVSSDSSLSERIEELEQEIIGLKNLLYDYRTLVDVVNGLSRTVYSIKV